MKKLAILYLFAIQSVLFAQNITQQQHSDIIGGSPLSGGGDALLQQRKEIQEYQASNAANLAARQREAAYQAQLEKSKEEWTPPDAWRIIDGETNSAKDWDNGWVRFTGKVIEVQPGKGIRVSGKFADYDFTLSDDDNMEFFVAGFPYDVADGDNLGMYAAKYQRRNYTYITTIGGSHTVKRLDYGTPCDEPDAFKQYEAWKEKQKEDAVKSVNEAAMVASQQKKEIINENVLKWNQSQAEKGDAYGLLRMAERYRDGDGVPKDLEKSKDYFIKAANAGSEAATKELAKLH